MFNYQRVSYGFGGPPCSDPNSSHCDRLAELAEEPLGTGKPREHNAGVAPTIKRGLLGISLFLVCFPIKKKTHPFSSGISQPDSIRDMGRGKLHTSRGSSRMSCECFSSVLVSFVSEKQSFG